MDLTKINQPFGTLDIETKLALHRAERLYREARAMWWATLLLAGVTLAIIVGTSLWRVM